MSFLLNDKIDEDLVKQFNAIKLEKKQELADYIAKHDGVQLDPNFIFDIQVKRLHEYKRQLLNAFSIMAIYFRLKEGKLPNFTPTAFILVLRLLLAMQELRLSLSISMKLLSS